MPSPSDFRQTWIWRQCFVNSHPDVTEDEQEFFRDRYLAMRDKAAILVSRIADAIPGLTVHDISHLDALWETASLVLEGATISISPAEAFVFGASVLLHDAGMSLAAYPNGMDDIKTTIEWRDCVATLIGDTIQDPAILENPPEDISKQATAEVLRQLHAKQAETLATLGWKTDGGGMTYLIEDLDLRSFYGETIGKIAHSHWWSLSKVEQELNGTLGAFAGKTKSIIDKVKIACLLRIADALHLDHRRAPRFLRLLSRPAGHSAIHWAFQEKLAAPHVEQESIVFSSAAAFSVEEAEAWWLAYDTISEVDRELREVDLLMQNRGRGLFFRARGVKGSGSPEALARTIKTREWRPVDTKIKVSDIPKVVDALGGAKLYGENPSVALRELIQNSADAIQARRRCQKRDEQWGEIKLSLDKRGEEYWLLVEDNGIGMSELVITGPLIDFGNSFWKSPLAAQEFPGLMSSGMQTVGRFGIGFFSVFMIGSMVRVYSRRYDRGEETARLLEFRDGTASRPILLQAKAGEAPIDGGTRVEILLKTDPSIRGGLLYSGNYNNAVLSLRQLTASIAPSIDSTILINEDGKGVVVVRSNDWVDIDDEQLALRLQPLEKVKPSSIKKRDRTKQLIQAIYDEGGKPLGRLRIQPQHWFSGGAGWVTIGGFRASKLTNVQGVLLGEALTVSRNAALPLIKREHLAAWASGQALIISDSNCDDGYKAKCAEIVLECGGDIATLPIVCWGNCDWLNAERLRERLAEEYAFMVSFDGEFSYDEDFDDVLPRDFRSNFEVFDGIYMVPKHDGSIIRSGDICWPRSISGTVTDSRISNLSVEVRNILKEVWSEEPEEAQEDIVVGTVFGSDITRQISVFRRCRAEEPTSPT